jgi:hypothetical protein
MICSTRANWIFHEKPGGASLAYVLMAQLGSRAKALQVLKEAKFPTNVIGGLKNAVGEILEAYRKSDNV